MAKLTSTGCLDTGSFDSTPSIKSSMNLPTTSQFGIPFELNRFLSVIWLHDVMLLLSCVVFKMFADDWWSFSSWKCLTFLETGFIWISGNCGLIGLNLLTSDELELFEDGAVRKLIVDEWVGLVWRQGLATASKIWLVLKSMGETVWVKRALDVLLFASSGITSPK